MYNPGWGGVYEVSNINQAEYTGVVLELVRRQYRNWQMEASYTWSRAIGDAEDFASFLGDDRTTRDNEYGYLSYDQRSVLKVNATTITPWGFRMGSTVQWQTGLPYSILDQTVSLDAAPPQYTGLSAPDARTRIRYPTRQRNDQRYTAFWTFDVRLDKELNLAKGLNMQLALDIYNLFNERVYMVYSPFAGYGAQINGFNQAFVTTGRTFQVGFKMSF
jgi:outer membrane receptor for ferrienterochelin and colicin